MTNNPSNLVSISQKHSLPPTHPKKTPYWGHPVPRQGTGRPLHPGSWIPCFLLILVLVLRPTRQYKHQDKQKTGRAPQARALRKKHSSSTSQQRELFFIRSYMEKVAYERPGRAASGRTTRFSP